MPTSAFIVKVPVAESLVGDLRNRFDATAQLGVPAHITVLFPFMAPADITPAVLEQARVALAQVPAFAFALTGVGQFPDTAYLVPTPQDAFIAMTQALVAAFPMYRPYGGTHLGVVPHLTAAHGDASHAQAVAAELETRLRASGPVQAECSTVTLIENSSGQWKDLHVFQLPPSAA
jgi:2'-5' RNA ligase